MTTTKAKGGSGETLKQMNRRHAKEFQREIEAGHYAHKETQPMSDTLQEREDQIVIEDCKVCGYLPHMPWCSNYSEPTVPCSICSTPTRMLSTKLCDRCWELKTRIESDPDIARRILTATTTHQPAAQGGGDEWRVEYHKSAPDKPWTVTVNDRYGTVVARASNVRAKQIVTEHNQHHSLVAERERLRQIIRDEVTAIRIWQHAIHPRSDVQEGLAISLSKLESALNEQRSTSE